MQLKIKNGIVELSGEQILKNVDIEINDNSRIAVVGRNGCGKTTLLKLISGEYSIPPTFDDLERYRIVSGYPKIGFLSQVTAEDPERTMLEEIRSAYGEIIEVKARLDESQRKMEATGDSEDIKEYTNLLDTFNNLGGFYYEREYESAIKHFGWTAEDKQKPLSQFSGGQRTKIAFLKLLLSKPDILLLDEPTNHLDIKAIDWLEEYLQNYKKAFVVVSHDRMFLDKTVNTVYEIENGATHKYAGNYTGFVELKKELTLQRQKEYEAQQKEIQRLNELVDRFRYKATKAAMAQSKLKQIDRMELIAPPEVADMRQFHAEFEPMDAGVKDVLQVKELKIGYDKPLSTVDLKLMKGDRIGIVGGNGLGKSTFIKTLMGMIPPLGGEMKFGPRVDIGYFDQQMAQFKSGETVLDDFWSEFPHLTETEARKALGAFLFTGEDVFKTVDMLSGGERVRLALCKMFKKRPNLLILDEPTNHMDIVGKETLESMLKEYSGTLLFVSHDRYFVRQIATGILSFTENGCEFYRFGYDEYMEKQSQVIKNDEPQEKESIKKKKEYTTPAKEKAKRERAIKKAEERIASLESELKEIEAQLAEPENMSDYVKLSELQNKQQEISNNLESAMEEWESLFDS